MDVWTHILNYLEYQDLFRLKCVNKSSMQLFQKPAINSIIKAKYTHYQHIKQLLIEMVMEATNSGTVYFTVKDVNFKLYQNDLLFQEYQADLHFNCINPWDQDCVDVSKLSRHIRIAHVSPFYASNDLDIQIDSAIAQYLKSPEEVVLNDKHIYPIRKYPGSPLKSENEFTFDYEPFENLWPLETKEIKICESYNIEFEDFTQLLSKIYKNIDQYWIIICHNKKAYQTSLQKYSDLLPFIVANDKIRYKYEQYNEYNNFNVIKLKYFN